MNTILNNYSYLSQNIIKYFLCLIIDDESWYIMNKKLFTSLFMLLLLISNLVVASSQQIYQNDNKNQIGINQIENLKNNIEKIVSFDDPRISYFKSDTEIKIGNSNGEIMQSGKPILPSHTLTFIFPFGTNIHDISIILSKENLYTIEKDIKTLPMPIAKSDSSKKEDDQSILQQEKMSNVFPKQKYFIKSGSGLKNNTHVIFLTITLYPIQYYPLNQSIRFSKNFTINITYESSQHPINFPDIFDMLIISPNEFSTSLQQLIDHKNAHNVKTFLQTTEHIYEDSPGRDNAEKIKYYIQQSIEEYGITKVLLLGDYHKIPIRKTAINVDIWSITDVPTDLYYADIYDANGAFCTWDSNNDMVFGECYADVANTRFDVVDSVDLYPDVGIGRLPCTNNFEVRTIANKIIQYETETSTRNWFDNMILLSGDTFPNNGEIYEGEIVTQRISELMSDFNMIELKSSEETFTPFLINMAISKGAGFVSYSGHGFERGFGTYPPNEENIIMYISEYLYGLFNFDKCPIMYCDACLTASPDAEVNGVECASFAWSMVKKLFGGSIANIGSTRIAYIVVDGEGIHLGSAALHVKFYENYLDGILLSDMFTQAQNDYINDCFQDYLTLEEFTLIGDPSLKIGGYF